MRFFASLLTTLPAALITQAAIIARQSGVNPGGAIVAPTAEATLVDGQTFPFDYANTNICHSGYSQIEVYLTKDQPTAADVNNGVISNPLFDFGKFTIANFGMSPPSAYLRRTCECFSS